MTASEHQIQAAYFDWVNIKALQDPNYLNIIGIPNAGKRSYALANRMRREGLRKGFVDVFIFVQNHTYAGMALEFKTEKGKPSPEQVEWLKRLNAAGYLAQIVRSTEQAMLLTEHYMLTAKPMVL